MALYEVYQMIGTITMSVALTQSADAAEKIAHDLQARGIPAFWEQVQ